jgi:hypothetical protein
MMNPQPGGEDDLKKRLQDQAREIEALKARIAELSGSAKPQGSGEQKRGSCCGPDQGIAGALDQEAWIEAVRGFAALDKTARARLLAPVVALVSMGLERHAKDHPSGAPRLSPSQLKPDDLIKWLFQSMVARRDSPPTRPIEREPGTPPSEPCPPPVRSEAPMSRAGEFERTLCEWTGESCVDLWGDCEQRFDGVCFPVPDLIAEYVTGEECICVKKPGWRDLALVACSSSCSPRRFPATRSSSAPRSWRDCSSSSYAFARSSRR